METDFKGLISFKDNLNTIFLWTMYKIPVDPNILKWTNCSANISMEATLLKATVNLSEVGDTYLDA
jgi:hypothetical protein